MRVAHIIIAHKNPLQLERLIRKMQHDNFDFYIHIDKKVNIDSFIFLKQLKGVSFISNRIECNWGGHSTFKAMVSSLDEVLKNKISYNFYNLLSAQDYPLRRNEEFYEFLKVHPWNSFIHYEPEEESDWWKTAVKRYQKYHLTDYKFVGRYFVEMALNNLLPIRKFPMPMKLYGGRKASWWTLNHECASYLSNFLKRKNKLDNFLKFCWGTDEFVIPTILLNSPLKNQIVNDNLRYIYFPEGKANPRTLVLEDLPLMVDSNMFFARKFELPMSAHVMAEIDKQTTDLIQTDKD